MTRTLLSLDIGSTWTKGALFSVTGEGVLHMERRDQVPTTTAHLPRGVYELLARLLAMPVRAVTDPTQDLGVEVHFSSSAKGGLRVAVLGLVPELSLHVARLTAWSSGARIVSAQPYRLTSGAIAALERENPDLLLFSGGTDGGNEQVGRHNAALLADSSYDGTILYAGNSYLADEITTTLAHKKLVVCENVMPELNQFNGEAARAAIGRLFLDTIAQGKGLGDLMERFNTTPLPTPRALLKLVGAVAERTKSSFMVCDMGGATTDIYSACDAISRDSEYLLKGVLEPRIKRSVEGDLGMRVSATSLLEVLERGDQSGLDIPDGSLSRWVERVSATPSLLGESTVHVELDALMARAAVREAVSRHVGRITPYMTTSGKQYVQQGKDLRNVEQVIFTGGYHSRFIRDHYAESVMGLSPFAGESELLRPISPDVFIDSNYVWPLLGNLIGTLPEAAAQFAMGSLTPVAP